MTEGHFEAVNVYLEKERAKRIAAKLRSKGHAYGFIEIMGGLKTPADQDYYRIVVYSAAVKPIVEKIVKQISWTEKKLEDMNQKPTNHEQ